MFLNPKFELLSSALLRQVIATFGINSKKEAILKNQDDKLTSWAKFLNELGNLASKLIWTACATFFLSTLTVNAAQLELTDFTGQTGPAPPPAPYTTTVLSIHDVPTPIDYFYIEVYWEGPALGIHQVKLNDAVFGGWDYTKVANLSGTNYKYVKLTCWTIGSPIPVGFTGNIAQIIFEVYENTGTTVTIRNGQYDFEGLTTKSATFTPGPGTEVDPFLPHIDGDANLNGKLDLSDVLIILRVLSNTSP